MTIKTKIEGQEGNTVLVDKHGALKVDVGEFNLIVKQVMDGTGVFSFFPPKAGEQFVITGIIMNASRSVTNEALVSVFEADSATGTESKGIIALDLPKNSTTPLLDVNILVTEGKWINGNTDDATCNVQVLGYYIEV